jgi:hypothetical protein
MDEPRAQRTLVKSPPELWAEVSDVEALAGHLGAFGEIRITRLEPETTVAWEGDRARGTVELEPSGWGTKVTLTARMEGEREEEPEPAAAPEPVAPEPVVAPEPAVAPEPVAQAEPEAASQPEPEDEPPPEPAADAPPPKRRGFFARLFARRRAQPEAAAPEPPAPEPAEPEPVAPEPAAAAPEATTPPPEPPAPPEPPPAAADGGPDALDAGRAQEILVGVLDDLGAARHRPFSRG